MRAVDAGLHTTLNDFDDHFEDVSKNPFNPDTAAALSTFELS